MEAWYIRTYVCECIEAYICLYMYVCVRIVCICESFVGVRGERFSDYM